MLTATQDAYGVVSQGYAVGWMAELTNQLLQTGRYDVRAQFGRSVLLEVRP
jgi:hypothetical protein